MRGLRLGPAAAMVAGLLIVGACVVYASTEVRLRRVYAVPPLQVEARSDPATLARGRHLVHVVAQCTTCHGADLGGKSLGSDPWLGRLSGPNLTRGRGGIALHSDAQLAASVRYGVDREGRPLVMMPAQYLRHLSDDDLGAIIGYLRSLPPVDRELPPRRSGPLSRLLLFLGRVPDVLPAESIARSSAPPQVPPVDAGVDYGRYLVDVAGCRVCHHENLAGGLHPLALPGEPVPADLTPQGPLGSWSEREFIRTLRTGVTPDGRALDGAYMPWRTLARMSDAELAAIWLYLRSL